PHPGLVPPRHRRSFPARRSSDLALLRLLREEGIGADVATAGELAFALEAGFSGAELVAHGNNKDEAFLRRSADEGATVVLDASRSEEHTSELQSRGHLVCRLLLE